MLNLVIFGPPGAGKGTQSAKLVERYQLIHLSTGDILRGEIAAGTILGQEAKILMDQGLLVPDEIVITMINNKLAKNLNAKGFIFDGFPRTTAQAQALDKLLTAKGTQITMTLALEVSTEELTKRIIQRGMESGRVDDQDEKTIRQRVLEYNQKTAPLKDYYTSQRKFRSVSGIGSVDEIFSALCNKVDSEYVPEIMNTPSFQSQTSVYTTVSDVSQKGNPDLTEKTVQHVRVVNTIPTTEKSIEKPILSAPAESKASEPATKKKNVGKPQKKSTPKKKNTPKKKAAGKKTNVKKKPVGRSGRKAAKPAPKKGAKKKIVVKKKTIKKKNTSKKKTAVVKKQKKAGKKSRR